MERSNKIILDSLKRNNDTNKGDKGQSQKTATLLRLLEDIAENGYVDGKINKIESRYQTENFNVIEE